MKRKISRSLVMGFFISVLILSLSCSQLQTILSRSSHISIRIEAEDYDSGGEGVGYHDTTLGNSGDEYRDEDVDIEGCWDGGYNIGWMEKGEWLQYSQVEGDGREFYLTLRVASKDRKGALRILVNMEDVTGLIEFKSTGGFQEWKTVQAGKVVLPRGSDRIRIFSEADGWNLDWVAFNTSRLDAFALEKIKPSRIKKQTTTRSNPRNLLTLKESEYKKGIELIGEKHLKVADKQGENFKILIRRLYLDELKKGGVEILDSTTVIPYKYQVEGFLSRVGEPVPRDDRGKIVVNNGYHDLKMVEELLQAFEEDYSEIVHRREIGKTWQGRSIWAVKISDNPAVEEDEPTYFFNGGHHADELIGTEFVLDIIGYLTSRYPEDEQVKKWVEEYEMWCVPLVNPDGNYRFIHVTGNGRKNGRDNNENGVIDPNDGVDLNRNYPFKWNFLGEKASRSEPEHPWYRGPEGASEPETQAVMRFADDERFLMAVSFHTSATKVLVPYTIDNVKNPEPSVAWQVGERMAMLSDSCRKDKSYVAARNLYSVDGTDQDWHYWRHGTLAYIWEGPQHNPDYSMRDPIVRGIRPGWAYMLDRPFEGPTLSGHVKDAAGQTPLEAVISLEEVRTFEGEVHTSHPDTGRFDLLLPEEGIFHLHIQKESYESQTIEVSVGKEWKYLDVFLQPLAE